MYEQPNFPVIKITGRDDVKEVSFGCQVSIDGVDLPLCQRATVVFDNEEFATVTLVMCGKVDLDGLKAVPMVQIVDERKESE